MTPIEKVRAALKLGKDYEGDNHEAIDEVLRLLDGMALVPIEPTEEMLFSTELDPDTSRAVYRAMIAPYVGEK